MKKATAKVFALVLVVVMTACALTACAKTISGSYEGKVSFGIAEYNVAYKFSGNKFTAVRKTTSILGNVAEITCSGTYEITENDDGTMLIALDYSEDDEYFEDGTFTFEQGDDYIKIGIFTYNKE